MRENCFLYQIEECVVHHGGRKFHRQEVVRSQKLQLTEQGNTLTHFVKYSENTTTYRLPALETGNGPIMSQATQRHPELESVTGALCRLRGLFFIVQSQQLRHQ